MKATGIVRRIDDLGRVVIPKEIRRTMRIREGDPLEIYTDADGEVIFKKYSPIGELSNQTKQYAEVLYRNTNLPVLITDRDRVIACAGIPKKDALERRVGSSLESIMESRSGYVATVDNERIRPIDGLDKNAGIAYPIIGAGDVSGSVIILMNENGSIPTPTEIKLTQVAASFLGKQMEE
ncbi:MAG: AbrB/MazE/SpoVT family DNA-binding domain-containing protein [Clostridiales bacterium]|jgi:AbrB family transcriptional regulator (stage V sporulation protein T)|nr:AbrB/MazE/SpoVT family DNA-binding domain-containing protein [Clostridiales bacterium]